MPLISVIIPLYNKERQIKHTIDSILNQEVTDYEIIIINDGSIDNSLRIVEGIDDKRIRIFSQSNSGVSAARNRGIAEARGEFLFLLDADDCLLPGAFNVLSEGGNADLIIASFEQIGIDGQVSSSSFNLINGRVDNPYKSLCSKDIFLRIGNFFIKKNLVTQIGGFREELSLYEDEEWILRVLDCAKVYSSSRIMMNYIRGDDGLSFSFKPIDKDWASIATVKGVGDKYKRRVIGDFVFRRLFVRLRRKDWHGVRVIWQNNSWRMLYCLFAFISRSFYKISW